MNPKTHIDAFSEEPPKRGRPRIEQYTTISGRAANYRSMLSEKWPDLGKPLMSCQRAEDVTEAFQKHAEPYAQEFVPRLAPDIFELMREAKFPQRANAQIKYIAESVAGRSNITFRTSRDVCAKLRAEEGRSLRTESSERNFMWSANADTRDRRKMTPVESAGHRFRYPWGYCRVLGRSKCGANTCVTYVTLAQPSPV